MFTKQQVDEMLSQVEQEFEKTLGSIAKNEEIQKEVESEEIEASEEEFEKSEDEDFETIDDLYASMTKSEQEAHYSAIKKAMFDKEEEETEQVEEVAKSKKESEEEKIAKFENKDLKSENEELKKNLSTLNELVEKMFSFKKAPAQKAITSADYIAKSEEEIENDFDPSKMSKGEITSKLQSLDYSSLSKNDREAINSYYLENASVNKIKHLIKE